MSQAQKQNPFDFLPDFRTVLSSVFMTSEWKINIFPAEISLFGNTLKVKSQRCERDPVNLLVRGHQQKILC